MQTVQVTKDVTIKLSPEHLGIVMNHLIEGKHKVVTPVINSIENQVIEQIQKTELLKSENNVNSKI